VLAEHVTNPDENLHDHTAHRLRTTPRGLVRDVRAAAEFYTKKLGFIPALTNGDQPTFADVNPGHVQIFLHKGTTTPRGCSVYFVVGDADELYEFHRANGVEFVVAPKDQPYRLRDQTVRVALGMPFLPRLAAAAWSGAAQKPLDLPTAGHRILAPRPGG
jgi:catechol 2,3-dioxygenase-like lactoylglutathione lyase family enzyme